MGLVQYVLENITFPSAIACFALLFTIYQGYKIREHNRLSVKPFITFEPIQFDTSSGYFCISIANRGLGTAIIKKFNVSLEGKVISYMDLKMVINETTDDNHEIEIGNLGENNALSKDQIFNLIRITLEISNENNIKKIEQSKENLQQKKLTYTIEYESIHKEKDTFFGVLNNKKPAR